MAINYRPSVHVTGGFFHMTSQVCFGPTYYHTDGLGSVVAMTDSQSRNIQQYEYDSFGNQHDMKNWIKQPYGYTGREHDRETGLRYYRARYYDGEVGRFISEDSIGFEAGNNFLIYTLNNPVLYSDPTGNDVFSCYRPMAVGSSGLGELLWGELSLGHNYIWSTRERTGFGLVPRGGYWTVRSLSTEGTFGEITYENTQYPYGATCELISTSGCEEDKLIEAIKDYEGVYIL